MFQIAQMDHIVLNVSDIDRALHFYSEILGLDAERVDEFRAGKIGFPSVRLNDQTVIDLFPPGRQEKPLAEGFAENLNHLCLVMENDDVDAVIEYLKKHQIDIERGPTHGWGARGRGTSLYIRDPDRNVVEVRTYAPSAAGDTFKG